MIFKKHLLFVICTICFCSCVNQTAENEELVKPEEIDFEKQYPYVIPLNRENDLEDVYLSSICDSVFYIPLETKSASLLPSFRGATIVVTDEEIVVFATRGIFLFDISGDFIRQIGKYGRGPGEYNLISGGWINSTNDTIACNDLTGNKIILYSAEGDYLKTLPFKNVQVLSGWGNYMILDRAEPEQPLFSAVSFAGETIFQSSNLYERPEGIMMLENQMFYPTGNTLLYRPLYNDTIFEFDSRFQKKPAYILDLGNYKYPYLDQNEVISDFEEQINNYIFCSKFFELKRTTLFWANYFGQTLLGTFDLETRQVLFAKDGLTNDLDGGISLYPRFMSKNQNHIISYIEPLELKTHVASAEFKNATPKYLEKKKELEELANSLDENDNPVLMVVKLKE